MEVVSILFGLIWMIVVITIIVRVAAGASKAARQQQISQRLQQPQQNRAVYDAQQQNLDRMKRLDQSSSARRVPSGSYSQAQQYNRAYSSKPVDVKTTSVLLEDRRNDWLAQQLREEAALKRRAGADLGAVHEVECAADDLKRSHARRHNTTGINRNTFR